MAKDRFYLLGNEAMGGHRARQGFRFQDLWLAFQLLDWITQQDFHGAVNEGLDDVDASWSRSDKRGGKDDRSNFDWEIHQLKDTSITPKLLTEIFDGFRRKEKQFAGTLSRYHVVATRCMERLNSLPALLRQTRNYLFTHGVGSPVATAAIAEFGQKLTSLGVEVDPDFVVDRVELDFASAWVTQGEVFAKQFHLRLAGHGIIPDQLEDAGKALLALVSGEAVGKLIQRASVVALLDQFKAKVAKPVQQPAAEPATITVLPPPSFTRPGADGPILISILAGGAALLRLSEGRYGLVDCNMTAATQIAAYFDAFKVDAFDFVAITHWDADRFSGLLAVMSAVKHTNKLFLPSPAKVGPYAAQFVREIEGERGKRHGIGEVVQTNARSLIWSSSDGRISRRVETFAADHYDVETRREAHRPGHSRNDLCSVIRVSIDDHHFLITGDASIKRWNHLLTRLVRPDESFRADGITLPHHGSRHALNKDVLGKIADPSGFYAVVDPAPVYGLPRPDVLKLVREANGEILVADGTPVHLLLTPDGLFERRFGLGRAGELRVVRPPGGRIR